MGGRLSRSARAGYCGLSLDIEHPATHTDAMQPQTNGTPASLDPVDVVRAAAAALEAERWVDLLPLVDLDHLAAFHASYLNGLRRSLERGPRTAEEVRAEQPWLPLEVAAYYAQEETTAIRRGRPQMLREWDVRDVSELEAMTPKEFFMRFLAVCSPSAKLRQAWAVSHTPVDDPATIVAQDPPRVRRVVIGGAVEADRYAHVLFREHHDDEEEEERIGERGHVRFTTLDRTRAGWRLRIDHTLLAEQSWVRTWRGEPTDAEGSADE